jgi:hypothetical protein
VIIGEIAAGVIAGHTGFDVVKPANVTTWFLGEVGFAMLMLTAGMHLPLRDRRLFPSLRRGALLALTTGVLAVPAGSRRRRAGGHFARRGLCGRAGVRIGCRAAACVRGDRRRRVLAE